MAQKMKLWRGKMMHGSFPHNLDKKLVGNKQSYQFGDIKGERESTIVAAQDQAICTNYLKNKMLKEETISKCQLCKQHKETIVH